jgi:D-alanine--poly(phosphoribitol) ligase subunit 1
MDLLDRIDRWGTTYPDRVAHVSGARVLTYRALVEQSNSLARHLGTSLPDTHSPVALLGHKENEMLVGFLACVKAGHPYIPLDASLPKTRVQTIIQTAHATLLAADEVRTILKATEAPPAFHSRQLDAADLWYVIFTSGSTGHPKGVMISKGCLESFVNWILEEQGFREAGEIFLNQAPFSFDLSVMDLYASLATGGTLFSISQDQMSDPKSLFEALSRSGVSVWVSTPSFARFCLMQPTFSRAMLPQCRKFWFCGETLAPEIAADLLRRFPGAEVWNTYGPTETTVATTSIQITQAVLAHHNPLPVGRAKPGTKVLIHDENGAVVPGRGRGEIVIAGPNVGLGYIHRPDLTERAFFELDGQRAYRTGDWGHDEDGLLFFEGRMDSQIKLHGYRIEIGDIEANLHKLEQVRDAVVVPAMRNDRADYLVAFTILRDALSTSEFEMSQQLRRQLEERLPDYMVPRKFVFLTEFPTTGNGKVDRKKLSRTLE